MKVLMWIPTAINMLIAMSILHLYWERYIYSGPKNTAQGEMGPALAIMGISAPMALLLLLGWFVLLLLRRWVPRDPLEERERGVTALVIGNMVAPILLFVLLGIAA